MNESTYKGCLDQSQHSICNTLHGTNTVLWLVIILWYKCCAVIGQSTFIRRSIDRKFSVASQPPTWKNLLNSCCQIQEQGLWPSVAVWPSMAICGLLWPPVPDQYKVRFQLFVCLWVLYCVSDWAVNLLRFSQICNLTKNCLHLLLVLCQVYGRKHALCSLCGHVEDTKVLLWALSQETVR